MSDAGSVLDKLLAHATAADANYSTTRGVRLPSQLLDEEYPHVFAFEPGYSIATLGFLQEELVGTFTLLIATKDETQEALLVRVDALRTRIRADRTLTSTVDDAFISEYQILEDPRTEHKSALITVTTEELE